MVVFTVLGLFLLPLGRGIGGTSNAVSYTHLDVYKRQIIHQQDLKIPIGLVQDAVHAAAEISLHIVDPVSYTHLTVAISNLRTGLIQHSFEPFYALGVE